MSNPTNTDATLWTLLGEELDGAALPLPPRTIDVVAIEAEGYKVAIMFAQAKARAARDAGTVRPGRN